MDWKMYKGKKKRDVIWHLLSVQSPDRYGTRLFLSWVRSQGCSPHTSNIAKNTFGHVGIPLNKGERDVILKVKELNHICSENKIVA